CRDGAGAAYPMNGTSRKGKLAVATLVRNALRSGLLGAEPGLADGALLAEFRAAAGLAGLFVILALPQLFLDAAALEQFLEPAQGQADRLPIMNKHPQRHADSPD